MIRTPGLYQERSRYDLENDQKNVHGTVLEFVLEFDLEFDHDFDTLTGIPPPRFLSHSAFHTFDLVDFKCAKK